MPSATVTARMPRPAAEVFALLHNYDRRLEWDTLLKEARLTRGNIEAGKGATSLRLRHETKQRLAAFARFMARPTQSWNGFP